MKVAWLRCSNAFLEVQSFEDVLLFLFVTVMSMVPELPMLLGLDGFPSPATSSPLHLTLYGLCFILSRRDLKVRLACRGTQS